MTEDHILWSEYVALRRRVVQIISFVDRLNGTGLTSFQDLRPCNVLQRCQRDAHVPTQHIQAAPKLYETVGRALLAQPIDTATL